ARLNTVEQWVIVNSTEELHVFHMHTYPMQVMSVNGVPTPFDGYQDEVDLPPHGYVVARFNFIGYTGLTVFHCHILAHEDMGMMANLEVTRCPLPGPRRWRSWQYCSLPAPLPQKCQAQPAHALHIPLPGASRPPGPIHPPPW